MCLLLHFVAVEGVRLVRSSWGEGTIVQRKRTPHVARRPSIAQHARALEKTPKREAASDLVLLTMR